MKPLIGKPCSIAIYKDFEISITIRYCLNYRRLKIAKPVYAPMFLIVTLDDSNVLNYNASGIINSVTFCLV